MKLSEENKNKLTGAVIGACVLGFVQSKTFKNIAVKTVAYGMKTKDKVNAAYSDVVDSAKDIYEEAKLEK